MRKTIYTMLLLSVCLHVAAQPGTVDAGFGGGTVKTDFGGDNDQVWAIAIQSDGKVVVAGFTGNGPATDLTSPLDIAVARYNTNGTLDNTFSGDGKYTLNISANDQAHGIAIQSDGKIVVVGNAGFDIFVLRLNSNGTPDLTFDGDGRVTTDIDGGTQDQANGVLIQGDGKYMVIASRQGGASQSDYAVLRYNNNGTLDNTFSGDGKAINDVNGNNDDYPLGIVRQIDGKYVVTGTSLYASSAADVVTVRYNADGTLDNTFSGDGIVITNVNTTDIGYDLAIDASGRIVVAGYAAGNTYHDDDNTRNYLVIRYTSTGTLDASFNGTGIANTDLGAGVDDKANDIGLQNDGKIVVGGYSDRLGNHDLALVRYNSNGTLDNTFDGDGIASLVPPGGGELFVGIAMKLYANRIYLVGSNLIAGSRDFLVAAFQNDGSPLPLTLLSFNAAKQSNNVLLQWQTEKEINVYGFDIERSIDGRNFKSIGYALPIADNGMIKKNYSYVDNQPLSATNYYRLVIHDIDGSKAYSKILAIRNNSVSQQLEVFPSPVSSTLQIQLPSGLTGKTNIQISDVAGRVIKTLVLEPKGYSVSTSVDVNALNKGVYFIVVKGENNVKMISQFVKN